jgi:hypothetical protein
LEREQPQTEQLEVVPERGGERRIASQFGGNRATALKNPRA